MKTRVLVLLAAFVSVAPAAEELFQRDKVRSLHLTISEKEWDAIQPSGGRMPFGPGGGFNPQPVPEKKEEKKDDEPRDKKKSAFGMTFPYGKGQIEFEGNTWKDVGVRFKGNSTYNGSTRGNKRPFKIDFDRHVPGQVFQGYETLNLQNDIMDSSHLRQAIAYQLFTDAGIPSPRTTFARMTLTVPGKHEKQYLGLYTVIEEVNKAFLKRHFASNKGLLLKPERIQGLPYLGENWKAYANYQPKTDVKPELTRRFIEFVRLVDRANDEDFRKQIASYLEIDSFLRFLAVNVLIVNLDSFMGLGHNYYMYLDPKTNKVTFIPWDLDLSFAAFGMGGNDQINLSIDRPAMGNNKLISRLLAMPEYKKAYHEHLKKLTEGAFKRDNMNKTMDALNKVLASSLRDEPRGGGGFGPGGFGGPGGGNSLKSFVEKRTDSVVAQLDGKSEGVTPRGFGPGGFGGPGGGPGGFGPGGFGPGSFLVKPLVEATDKNKDGKLTEEEALTAAKKLFVELDKDKKGSLDEKALTASLEKLLPAPPAPPGGGFGGPGGPGGFRPRSPAPGLAISILKQADTDKDGQLTEKKLIEAVKVLFKESDKNKDGKLDEKELGEGIAKLMPPPRFPGFGGGPGVPGGERPRPQPEGGRP